jgi:hypothetical protein
MSRFERLPNGGVGLPRLGGGAAAAAAAEAFAVEGSTEAAAAATTATAAAAAVALLTAAALNGDASALLRVDGVPANVSTSRWDVILVDGPAG